MSAPLSTKHLTLLLLHDAANARVLLGLKLRGFGAGKWNGFGGKIEPGETVLAAALREMAEECSLHVFSARYAAHVTFDFVGAAERMSVHVLTASRWRAAEAAGADAAADAAADLSAEPVESDEMRPRWFPTDAIPFGEMWLDDRHWLPPVLAGKCVSARFLFRGHDEIVEQALEEVPETFFAGAELAVPVPAGAPLQASIAPGFGADAGAAAEQLAPRVPLRFVASGEPDPRRPAVAFRSRDGGNASSIARGGAERVRASSAGGWVFCGLGQGGCGEYIAVAGGSAVLVSGFSGDDCQAELELSHDGVAREVVVTFSTRPD